MKMIHGLRWLHVSLLLHAAAFGLVIGLGKAFDPNRAAIVIDLSIESAPSGEARPEKIVRRRPWAENRAGAKPVQSRPETKVAPEHKTSEPAEASVPMPAPFPAPPESGYVPAQGVEQAAQPSAAPAEQGWSAVSGSRSMANAEEQKIRYLKEHFAFIRDRIMRNITYPRIARRMGWSGKVTVAFLVHDSGLVEDIRVVESSGHEVLDQNAIEAVRKSCPLPKPPVAAQLVVPVVYRIE